MTHQHKSMVKMDLEEVIKAKLACFSLKYVHRLFFLHYEHANRRLASAAVARRLTLMAQSSYCSEPPAATTQVNLCSALS